MKNQLAMAYVRSSKYRHVFGSSFKKDQCYEGIRVSRNNWDGAFCAVNGKFIAVITESSGGGSFIVLKHDETGRVDLNKNQVCGHKAAVLDLAWNPFNDNIIASGSDDLSVKIWQIPDEGVTEPMIEPLVDLQHHQKRVGQVLWHPSAENILLSVGGDNVICIWNLEEATVATEITCHPDLIHSVSFNCDGSLIASTCKDKKLRIIDPRSGEVKKESLGHEGSKISRVAFMKNNKLFTTGFSKMSERQYAVWDGASLKNLALESIDNNNAPLTIQYDPDIDLIYLVGKGDTLIRYYEVTDTSPYCYWLSNHQSKETQRCCAFIPKRNVNVNTHEIARIYKVTPKGMCEPIAMIVPRKSDLFQDDIYPDTAGDNPALSAVEWLSGKNANPLTVSLKEGYKSMRATSEVKTGGMPKSSGGLKGLSKKSSSSSSTPAAAPESKPASAPAASRSTPATNGTTTPSSQGKDKEISELRSEVDKLKALVEKQETRIAALENKM